MSALRLFLTPFDSRKSSAPPPAAAAGGWVTPARSARRRSRWLFGAVALGALILMATWTAVRTVPWFGPFVADGLRTLLGSERVTKLEEAVAAVEDDVKQVTNGGQGRTLSDATPAALLVASPQAFAPRTVERRPADVTPPYTKVSTREDGVWLPVSTRAGGAPSLYRTMLHPDTTRAYAELFVFALDLSKLEVRAVAGSVEPKSDRAGTKSGRPGVVPEIDRPKLVAAFNGGFKAEHGQFGMMVDGRELLAPKQHSCTLASTRDGALRIGTWTELESTRGELAWWRQTPGCMFENGVLHPGLRSPDTKNWGATLDGNTVIRRSAVGLSSDGKTLFVGISNSTTARAMAFGMNHAGAVTVAQLDVNFSFPRFLLYQPDAETGELSALGAVKGLLYEADEYLERASTRDFFYVTAR
ncbi:MAG TPA: phosphodiester glycosidase family protein [Polyangiaceae bacterium]|nr:phosphodiester glycosidase family protein [Polyangiaceae bacterium]